MRQRAHASKASKAARSTSSKHNAPGNHAVGVRPPSYGIELPDGASSALGASSPLLYASNDGGGIALSPPRSGLDSLDQGALVHLHGRETKWLDIPAGPLPVRMDAVARRKTEAYDTPGLMEGGFVYLHPERFDPRSPTGGEILALEASHVVQRDDVVGTHGALAAVGSPGKKVGKIKDLLAKHAIRSQFGVLLSLFGDAQGSAEWKGDEFIVGLQNAPVAKTIGKLNITGTLDGSVSYVSPSGLKGKLTGTGTLTAPGLGDKLGVTLCTTAGVEGITLEASLASPWKKGYLTVNALDARYEGGALSFAGDATVEVAGKFRADMAIAISSDKGLVLDGTVTARQRLPLLGDVDGKVELEHGDVTSVTLDANDIHVKKTLGKIAVDAKLQGSLTWTPQGGLHGEVASTGATLKLPGINDGKAIDVGFLVTGGATGVDVAATLNKDVQVGNFATLKKLSVKFENEALSFTGAATAKVPFIGDVSGTVTFKDNDLDSLTLNVSSRKVAFSTQSPIVQGTAKGTATWHAKTGAVDGDLSAPLTVTVPGVPQFSVTLSLVGDTEKKTLGAKADLTKPVPLTSFLKVEKLTAEYKDGEPSLEGSASLSIPNNTLEAEGGLTARIDKDGFHLVGGSAGVAFKVGTSFGGKVTAKYANNKLTVGGGVDISFGKFSASASLSGTGEVFDAEIKIPAESGKLTGEGAVTNTDGLILFGGTGTTPKKNNLNLPKVEIPIFTLFIATLTANIGIDLDYGVGLDPLTVGGAVKINGIDLANGTVRELLLDGNIKGGAHADLTLKPGISLGLSVIHPKLIGVSGGLGMDLIASAGATIEGAVKMKYTPGVGLDVQQAKVNVPIRCTLKADPNLYVDVSALFGLFYEKWRTPSIGSLTLMEDKQLFVVKLDLLHLDKGIEFVNAVGATEATAPSGEGLTGMSTPAKPATSTSTAQAKQVVDKDNVPLNNEAATHKKTKSPVPAETGGEKKNGMFDFTTLVDLVTAVAPGPVSDVKTFFETMWKSIEKIVDSVIKFFDWIADRAVAIVTKFDLFKTFWSDVLEQWRRLKSGDLTALWRIATLSVGMVRTVLAKFGQELQDDNRLTVLREQKGEGVWDWTEADTFHLFVDIPGILTLDNVVVPNLANSVEWFCAILGIAWVPYDQGKVKALQNQQTKRDVTALYNDRERDWVRKNKELEAKRKMKDGTATLQFLDRSGNPVGDVYDLDKIYGTQQAQKSEKSSSQRIPERNRSRIRKVRLKNIDETLNIQFAYDVKSPRQPTLTVFSRVQLGAAGVDLDFIELVQWKPENDSRLSVRFANARGHSFADMTRVASFQIESRVTKSTREPRRT